MNFVYYIVDKKILHVSGNIHTHKDSNIEKNINLVVHILETK